MSLCLALAVAEIVASGSNCRCVRNLWYGSCDSLVALTVVFSVAYEMNSVTCAGCCKRACSCSFNFGNDF